MRPFLFIAFAITTVAAKDAGFALCIRRPEQKEKVVAERRGRRRVTRFMSIFAVAVAGLTPLASLHAQSADAPYTVTTPAPEGFDRAQAQSATLAHLQALIGRDTQNPPGKELLTAQPFDRVFAKIGVERLILLRAGTRELRGAPACHQPLQTTRHDHGSHGWWVWTPQVEDATVRGHGGQRPGSVGISAGAAIDKGMLGATAALQQLAARRDQLDRDVIFLATAAEEGGAEVGIEEMVGKLTSSRTPSFAQ